MLCRHLFLILHVTLLFTIGYFRTVVKDNSKKVENVQNLSVSSTKVEEFDERDLLKNRKFLDLILFFLEYGFFNTFVMSKSLITLNSESFKIFLQNENFRNLILFFLENNFFGKLDYVSKHPAILNNRQSFQIFLENENFRNLILLFLEKSIFGNSKLEKTSNIPENKMLRKLNACIQKEVFGKVEGAESYEDLDDELLRRIVFLLLENEKNKVSKPKKSETELEKSTNFINLILFFLENNFFGNLEDISRHPAISNNRQSFETFLANENFRNLILIFLENEIFGDSEEVFTNIANSDVRQNETFLANENFRNLILFYLEKGIFGNSANELQKTSKNDTLDDELLRELKIFIQREIYGNISEITEPDEDLFNVEVLNEILSLIQTEFFGNESTVSNDLDDETLRNLVFFSLANAEQNGVQQEESPETDTEDDEIGSELQKTSKNDTLDDEFLRELNIFIQREIFGNIYDITEPDEDLFNVEVLNEILSLIQTEFFGNESTVLNDLDDETLRNLVLFSLANAEQNGVQQEESPETDRKDDEITSRIGDYVPFGLSSVTPDSYETTKITTLNPLYGLPRTTAQRQTIIFPQTQKSDTRINVTQKPRSGSESKVPKKLNDSPKRKKGYRYSYSIKLGDSSQSLNESSDGRSVKGVRKVKLPNGRTEVINYDENEKKNATYSDDKDEK